MEAGFAPGVLYYLTLWFPESYRGRATSMLFLASAMSGLVGAPISGLILGQMNGVLGQPGWHWLFLIGGLPCLPLGWLVLRRFQDRVQDADWLSAAERSYLATQIKEPGTHAKGGSLWGAITTPGFLVLGLVYFLIQVGSYGLNFWAPHLIRSSGISSSTTIGLLTAVPYVFGAICMVVVGRVSDANGERRAYVAGLLVAAAVGFFARRVFRQADRAADRRAGRDGRRSRRVDPGFLGAAAAPADRRGRRGRHRADQHAGPAGRHRQPRDGGPHQGRDRLDDAGALRDRPGEPRVRRHRDEGAARGGDEGRARLTVHDGKSALQATVVVLS